MKFFLALLLIVSACSACVSSRKHDIDANLISGMEKNCRNVEIKMDYDQGVYIIAYTGKVSKDRCPIALIQGWKDGGIIKKKEIEICGCKDR